MSEYPKKYWWVVLIAVPLCSAMLTTIPSLLEVEQRAATESPPERPEDPRNEVRGAPRYNDNEGADESGGRLKKGSAFRTIQATGTGYAPADVKDQGRRLALAGRAAEVAAMRNLSEKANGVFIEAQTETQFGTITEDVIIAKIGATLKRAQEVSRIENSDGSVTVTMAISVPVDLNQ